MVIDMNVVTEKQSRRKKSTTQKKNKLPQRGMGIEKLEQQRKMTETPSPDPIPISIQPFHPSSFSAAYTTSSSCTTLPNGGLQFRYGYPPTTPVIMFNGSGSTYGSDHVIRFENSKELSSIPNYIKCASDGCGVCHKKIRIHGGGRYFSSGGVDAGRTRGGGGGQVTEYEFFPGKGMIGLQGGEGSCVTAVTGNEEGSVSSVDLSLKL